MIVADFRVYRFYDEREDTLLNGLTNVNKKVRRYSDGSKKVVMGLIIDESDSLTGPYTRCVYLDAAEISKFDAFIDSCCSKPQKRNERWELQLKSGAIFSYDEYNKTIAFWCDQGRYVGLQITPQRFKEVLTQIMEDEAFRVDD